MTFGLHSSLRGLLLRNQGAHFAFRCKMVTANCSLSRRPKKLLRRRDGVLLSSSRQLNLDIQPCLLEVYPIQKGHCPHLLTTGNGKSIIIFPHLQDQFSLHLSFDCILVRWFYLEITEKGKKYDKRLKRLQLHSRSGDRIRI